jgi:prolyl 4-hydroxylase
LSSSSSSSPGRNIINNNNNSKKRGGGGGGFGTSSTISSSSSSNKKKNDQQSKVNNNNNKKKKKLMLDDDLFQQPSSAQPQQEDRQKQQQPSSSSNNADVVVPLLDKWGLPPPTMEDIFPRMPPGTELIAARSRRRSSLDKNNDQEDSSSSAAYYSYTLEEIQAALHNCLPLPGLSTFFDNESCEQKPSTYYIHDDDNDNERDDDNDDDGRRDYSKLPMKLHLVHESPPVLVIDNFLSKRECMEIEQLAMPTVEVASNSSSSKQQKVVEVGSALFSEGSSYSPYPTASQLTKRTSTSWFCEYRAVPQLLAAAQYVLGLNIQNMEEPQIVRYQTGQEFTWHYDQVPDALLANGGQRMATLLVYLNTVQQGGGGGTVFRDLKKKKRPSADDDNNIAAEDEDENENENNNMLTVQPVQGRACIFFPATFANYTGISNNGTTTTRVAAVPDDRTLHKGQVVTNNDEEKRIVQIWIHQDPYRATLPSTLNRQDDAIPAIQQLARQRQWDKLKQHEDDDVK